jgi:hypothetical protein
VKKHIYKIFFLFFLKIVFIYLKIHYQNCQDNHCELKPSQQNILSSAKLMNALLDMLSAQSIFDYMVHFPSHKICLRQFSIMLPICYTVSHCLNATMDLIQ